MYSWTGSRFSSGGPASGVEGPELGGLSGGCDGGLGGVEAAASVEGGSGVAGGS